MKTLAIIGSTGSIGKSALEVYKKNKKSFKLIALAANTNLNKLIKQYLKFKPEHIFLTSDKDIKNVNKKYLSTKEIFLQKRKKKIDYVISGASGYDAIKINFELIKISKKLLIANKETIVCGGRIFLELAKKYKCEVIPIDSEHHCIDLFLKSFKFKKDIKKIYITASGGPFLKKKINYNEKLNKVVNHPTWKMGKKISVDSSTFANKVLELFEAKILFELPNNKLGIKIERRSNTHAIIKLNNNIILPIMHAPNMTIPISNALNIKESLSERLILKNIKNLNELSFSLPNKNKFPLLSVINLIPEESSNFETILITLNDSLVDKYLNGKINYLSITKNLLKLIKSPFLLKYYKLKPKSIYDIKKMIEITKNYLDKNLKHYAK